MNKAAIHFSILCILLIALFGCSDKAGNPLTDSSATPTLASTISATSVTVEVPGLTRENVVEFAKSKADEGWDGIVVLGNDNGSSKVTLQKEVKWDGVSPLLYGTLYSVASEEALKKAQAITDAYYGRTSPAQVKSKDDGTAQLATGSWLAEAGFAQIACNRCQMYGVTDNPSGTWSIKTHKLMSRKWNAPSTDWRVSQEIFEDAQDHWAYQSHYYTFVDAWMLVESSVWDYSTMMASDDDDEAYRCYNPYY